MTSTTSAESSHGGGDRCAQASRDLKLLVLEPDPSHGGGSEAVLLSLSRELAKRGHSIVLLHEREGSMLADYQEFATGTERGALPGFALRAPLRTFRCVLRIGRIARKLGVDAIVSSHLGFVRHCAIVRIFCGIPACFHLGLPLTHASRTMSLSHHRVGAGIAPSSHTAETWRAGGWPADDLHVVRNWVDPVRFKPAADVSALRRELDLPVDELILVFVGRVCEQKGVDVLIGAFSRLVGTLDNVNLVIVGAVAAEYHAGFKKALESSGEAVRTRIIHRPVTSSPERYYAAADVACAPSLADEAFGLTVVEAMACGVPVISSAIGIIPQIVGEEGADLLVPPGDHAELSERMHFWLTRHDARVACGHRLRERVLEHFGPAESIDRYEEIIRCLAGDGREQRQYPPQSFRSGVALDEGCH